MYSSVVLIIKQLESQIHVIQSIWDQVNIRV
jgi:hypothetical protein